MDPASWFARGTADVVAASRALAYARDAHGMFIEPDAVDSLVTGLRDLRDALDLIAQESFFVASHTMPIGAGYAGEIGRMFQDIASRSTMTVIPDLIAGLDGLIGQLDRSRASYHAVETAAAAAFDRP